MSRLDGFTQVDDYETSTLTCDGCGATWTWSGFRDETERWIQKHKQCPRESKMTRTIDMARTQLGVCEATGNNDGVPAERYMHGDRLPWCAGFILWCNAQSTDQKISDTLASDYTLRSVEALEAEMKRRGWWIDPRARPDAFTLPSRNDLVFFSDRGGSDHGPGRHVALAEGPVFVGGSPQIIKTIDGNWGNKVSRVERHATDPAVRSSITGYARIPARAP